MIKLLPKLFSISRADMLLVAATVVAALRMMLINSQAIGFNVKGWEWFAPAEVISGVAFAILEGVALAYVSKRWRRFQPQGITGWGYWTILLLGQLVLLGAIVWVTGVAFVATRRNLTIDEVLQPGAALAWSMLVAAINPLIVILIGIVEDDRQQAERPMWPPLEVQLDLFVNELEPGVTPDEAAKRFAELTGAPIAIRKMAGVLAHRNLARLSAKVDEPGGATETPTARTQAGATNETAQEGAGNEAITIRSEKAPQVTPVLSLAERRARVAEMVAQGMSQAGMARALGVNKSTVKRDLEALQQEVAEAPADDTQAEAVRSNGVVKV